MTCLRLAISLAAVLDSTSDSRAGVAGCRSTWRTADADAGRVGVEVRYCLSATCSPREPVGLVTNGEAACSMAASVEAAAAAAVAASDRWHSMKFDREPDVSESFRLC